VASKVSVTSKTHIVPLLLTTYICGHRPDARRVEDFLSSDVAKRGKSQEEPVGKAHLERTSYQSSAGYTGKSVTGFTLSNTRHKAEHWIDVLLQITKLMYNQDISNFNKVLQLRGRKRPYYTENKDELRVPQKIEGSEIFMETNLSSNQIVNVCKKIIALFGYSEEEFTVETR